MTGPTQQAILVGGLSGGCLEAFSLVTGAGLRWTPTGLRCSPWGCSPPPWRPAPFPRHTGGDTGTAYWLVAAGTAVVCFLKLLTHELAHALMARGYGMEVKRITLWILGGVTELGTRSPTARADAPVALAGWPRVCGSPWSVGSSSAAPWPNRRPRATNTSLA